MADLSVEDPIPSNPDLSAEFSCLPIPPLDPSIFTEDMDFVSDLGVFGDDVEDFNFTFDDLYLPSENEDFLASFPSEFNLPNSEPVQILDDRRVSNSSSPELDVSDHDFPSDQSSSGGRVLNSPCTAVCQVSSDGSSGVDGFLSVPSPESDGTSCKKLSPEFENHNREVSGPESSQGSGNSGSAVSEHLNYPSPDSGNCDRSAASYPNNLNNSINGVVDQKIKLEDSSPNSLLKRKKGNGDLNNSESRMSKYRRSNDAESPINEEDEKKKARLMRNRESAQLSRQRKKHYVEELEDKVRLMLSQLQDMNTKMSYLMAENATLRQQVGGGTMCPPPGMYPHPPMAPMGYQWMPCPPYVVKPNGSQVPLVPIPKLKPQQPLSAPKAKKVEAKKSSGKTKKAASVSFLGLLFFILFFGGLVPMVNVKYGGLKDAFPGRSSYFGNRINDQHGGWVYSISRRQNGTDQNSGVRFSNEKFTDRIHCGGGHCRGAESNLGPKERGSHPLPGSDERVNLVNASEPLVASLYVPRNDKLVKIDGNLIIHSVLASEKAMASRHTREMKSRKETTGLAVSKSLAPVIPVYGSQTGRHHPHLYRNPTERQRALTSGERENLKSISADGKLQEWFREGLAGPLLHTGMCTEVFQFETVDVSPASKAAIIPANSIRNISAQGNQNSTHIIKGKNRRILHGLPIPLPGSVQNITKEHVGRSSEKDNFRGNKTRSPSMAVSVLVDPGEAGDGDGDGMMGAKSIPRIFVVVLLDSVKYATYSCMLPLKGSGPSGPHLVTT